ncbi:hypothetical protein A1O1_04712 [Capronia coronata CBS 617.96]|uniref:Zn(2)-C6 fungal-type domain-containing protein n=1 Tax=Capronia coronata CBS 617.96 TaxID=1182541 RepID=W9YDM6_9EURO|nr:uncharacterized protein A1O1_04712 [Capronia coronata CBS 617.96]EXJ87785.1 hypothetical protein A1O1_04712 [Capronia coronata CBS 617.96]
MRCEKAGIACKGYHRDTVFVNRTPGNPSTTALSVLKRSVDYYNCLEDQPKGFAAHLEGLKTHLLVGPRTRYRLQALELLKRLYLPQPTPANIKKSSLFSWLPIVCELQGESQALDYCLLTFCVIQVAVSNPGSPCVDESLQVYNDALQKLRVEIEDAGSGQSDEILAAISVLSTCELFVYPTDLSWRAHAQGIREILRIRSCTDASSTTVWQSFCTRIRIVLLLEALSRRRAPSTTFPQCHQLASTLSKEQYDSLHALIDVAWEVPVLLEEMDQLTSSCNTTMPVNGHAREDLLKPSLAVLEKLYERQERYKVEKGTSLLYWAVPSSVDNPTDDGGPKLFPFALQFESLETACHMILWWAIVLQVLGSMIDLHEHFFGTSATATTTTPTTLPSTSDSKVARARGPESESESESGPLLFSYSESSPTSISSIVEQADKLARYICQSIEYCYQLENGIIGPQLTAYAQWVTKLYFRRFRRDRELAWCSNIKNMRGPGFRHGIELMGFQD